MKLIPLFLFAALGLNAQTRLENLLPAGTPLSRFFPAQEEISYRSDNYVQSTGARRLLSGTTTLSADSSGLRQESVNPTSRQTMALLPTLRLGNTSVDYLDTAMRERLGYDRMVTRLQGRTINTSKLKGQNETAAHTWNPGPSALDGAAVAVFLRGLLLSGRKASFLADIITKWDGGTYEMVFIPEDLSAVLARETSMPFPAAMRESLARFPGAVAWSMGLTGPASFFFPHKFYFAFENEGARRMIAFWGGPSDKASFTWIVSEQS